MEQTLLDAPSETRQPAFAQMRERMRTLPLQNIADIAKSGFGRDDIIPLWFGEGDLTTPAFICDSAYAAMKAGHTFYTHQNGIPELRTALSDYLSRHHGAEIGTERISVTPGGMAAILAAIQMVMDAGDEVLVFDPVWPNVRGAVRMMGGDVRSVRMDATEDGFVLDLDRVEAAMGARTKAVFFASPGNPTGWIMPPEQQAALLDLCRRRGIWIIADEVYTRFHYTGPAGAAGPAAPSMLSLADAEDLVLVVNSFSKAWCMTGWRLGWLTHPASLADTMAMVVQYNTSGVATFLQHAGATAIREGEPFVDFLVDRCRTARDIVCDSLENLPRISGLTRPQGGMYVYFRVEGVSDSRAACADILERTGVGLAPGFAFGDDDFLRICYCNDPKRLETAMERLRPVFM